MHTLGLMDKPGSCAVIAEWTRVLGGSLSAGWTIVACRTVYTSIATQAILPSGAVKTVSQTHRSRVGCVSASGAF